MERFLRKYDKECMKMAILKHEETFRQQVHDLHRLYSVQRLLMRDMKNNDQLRRQQRVRKCSQAHRIDNNTEEDKHNSRRNRRALNLELSADEYIEREIREDGVILEQDIDVELTLTVGINENTDQKKKNMSYQINGGEDANICYQNGMIRNRLIEYEEGVGENRLKHSPWLFHCLSLKMA